MSSKKNLAFLGCSHIHMKDAVTATCKNPHVAIKAVWDQDADRAAYWAERLNADLAANTDKAVSCADAVIVMSETIQHHLLAIKSVEAGKDVFIEKPLATSWTQARDIARAVKDSGVHFHTGYFLRNLDACQQLRTLVRSFALGKVVRVRALFSHGGIFTGGFDEHAWMTDPRRSGFGGFGDLGIHLIDLVLWLLGTKAQTATASFQTITAEARTEQCGEAMLKLHNGVIATIGAGWVEQQAPFELLVTGTQGYAQITDGQLIVETPGYQIRQAITAPNASHALRPFLQAITGQPHEPLVTVDEALHHIATLAACYKSAAEHAWVDVDRNLH